MIQTDLAQLVSHDGTCHKHSKKQKKRYKKQELDQALVTGLVVCIFLGGWLSIP